MAVEEGAKAVVCASTGNTSASAAAYAARAGLTCVVLIPDGHIALGKLAQALMHGARVLQVRGNFDQLLDDRAGPRRTARPSRVVNSVNPHRIEGQKTGAFEIVDVLGDAPDVHCIPVGNAGNIIGLLEGLSASTRRLGRSTKLPRMLGFQAAGAAPDRARPPGRGPRDHRHRHPDREPGQLVRRPRPPRPSRAESITAVTDDEILDAYTFLARQESIFCEAASSASVAGLIKQGVPEGSTVVCVLTGHGLKDPDLAIKAISVPSVIDARPRFGPGRDLALRHRPGRAEWSSDLRERGACWHDTAPFPLECVHPHCASKRSPAGTSGPGRAPRDGDPGEGMHTRRPFSSF